MSPTTREEVRIAARALRIKLLINLGRDEEAASLPPLTPEAPIVSIPPNGATTRSDLVARVAAESGQSHETVDGVLSAFLAVLSDTVKR